MLYRHARLSHGPGGLVRLVGTGIGRDDAAGRNTFVFNCLRSRRGAAVIGVHGHRCKGYGRKL